VNGFESRKDAIRRAAVEVMMRKGVRRMTFTEIAVGLDLVPSAIGYYYRRKDDLVAACFLQSVAKFESLTAAAAAGLTPAERVRIYLQALLKFWGEVLRGEAAPIVMFNEVRTIKDPAVDAAFMGMYRGLRRLLDTARPLGRLERNARAHQFLTQALWVTLWAQRYDPRDFPRVADRISDLMIGGLAGPGRSWSSKTLPGLRSTTSLGGDQDAFLKAATELINEDGYPGASVEKIAARLNLTKGAFYYRHNAKDDLVVAGFKQTLATIRNAQDQADHVGGDGLERLCLATAELFRGHLAGDAPLLRISALAAVSEEIGHDIFEDFSRVSLHFAGCVADGIADGSIRPVDPNIAGLMITAMISGSTELGYWAPGVTPANAAAAFFRPMVDGLFCAPLEGLDA
jgi:AcrR family transcriptional regulator